MANKHIGDLPHALAHGDELAEQLVRKAPAVFLDYDGTLTPIVDRPEDAIISESMRKAIRGLADTLQGTLAITYQGRSYDLGKPFRRLTLEQAIAYIEEDELVEVTPTAIRLRKGFLLEKDRKKQARQAAAH